MTHIEEIVNLIHTNEDLIDFDYKDIKDLIVIQGVLFKKITDLTSKIDDPNVDIKELTKEAVRFALYLDNQELVIVKKERIVIKIMINIKRTTIDEENPTEANRYNGYSIEKIEDLYYDYFDTDTLDDFIEDISYEVFQYLFLKKRVTNDFYEKNIYPIIQKIIIDKLDDFDVDINLKKGFAGYVLRINFLQVFTYISEDILESIAHRDEYLMNWIKYYHGQIVVDGHQRYQAPYMINPDGQKYNPSAIFGTISMWYKTTEKEAALQKRLNEAKEKVAVLQIDDLTPKEYKYSLIRERQEFEKDISDINEKLEELMKERHLIKDNDEKFEINEEIKELRQELREYKAELSEINLEVTGVDTTTSRGIEENIMRIEKALKHEQSSLKQNRKVYLSIKSALIKALTSKRKPIDK